MWGINSQLNRRARMIAIAVGAALLSLALLGLTMTTLANTSLLTAQPLDIAGYEDFAYNTDTNIPIPNHPTSEKPESKLWWHDGFWWGSLYNLNAGAYHIYRLDWGDQAWEDTGIVVDEREESRADVLFDATNGKLYISSHIHDESPSWNNNPDNWSLLYRYSYDMALQTYTLDSGFPVTTNEDTPLAQVIDKDSNGRLWTTYVSRDPRGTNEYEVYVNATTSASLAGDDNWDDPFSLANLFPDARVTQEDISTIFAYSETVALMWSNQLSNTLNFATHTAGLDLSTGWSHMTLTIPGPVDDHINVKVRETAGGDQIFAALKLGYDFSVSPPTSTYPLIGLLTRDTDGSFAFHEYSAVNDNDTRPIVTIDDENDNVYMFVSGKPGGSQICFKMASIPTALKDIAFSPGNCGVNFIADTVVNRIDSPTSAKHHFNNTTGLSVLATNSDSNFIYVHNVLGDPPPVVVAVAPDRNEAGVAVDAVVQATFSKDMDNATLTDSSFTLTGPDGLVAGSVTYNAATRTAIFAPDAPLVADTLYTATVSDAVADSGGQALFRAITWTFTTGGPTIAFDRPGYSVGEAALTATITVTLNTPSSQIVTVDYATTDGSATAGMDYVSASGQLAFEPGTLSQTFEVAILNDLLVEPNETVNLALDNFDGASGGALTMATLTINDDDSYLIHLPLISRP